MRRREVEIREAPAEAPAFDASPPAIVEGLPYRIVDVAEEGLAEELRPYIARSWLYMAEAADPSTALRKKTYLLDRNRELGAVVKDAFHVRQTRWINELLDRCVVLAAVLEDDPSAVWGFVVGERSLAGDRPPRVVHALYVRSMFRGYGVAAALLEALFERLTAGPDDTVVTLVTRDGRRLLRRARWHAVPLMAFVDRDGRNSTA